MEKKHYNAPEVQVYNTDTVYMIAESKTYNYQSSSESGTEFGAKEHTDDADDKSDLWN